MLKLVGQYVQGLKGPFKAYWAVIGCSIMADSWEDVQGRTIIIVLVCCPQWVIFCFFHYGCDQE